MKFTNALATSALFAAPALAGLTVEYIDVDPTDSFKFVAKVTNDGTEPVTLIDHPNSVVGQQFQTDIFTFESEDGNTAKFDGVYLKWDPKAASKVVLAPGESKEFEQDGSVYDFSQSGESTYKISGGDEFWVESADGEVTKETATLIPSTAKVSGKWAVAKIVEDTPAAETGTIVKRAYAHGCTPDQIKQISAALPVANSYISGALSYLRNMKGATPRYTNWFGTYDVARKNLVQTHYNNMVGDVSGTTTTYDCSTCPTTQYASAFAYVQTNKPYYVNLCSAFWSAPVSGTDSKAGTIVHELSHFTVNGGTRDNAYGHANAQSLARSNPAAGVMNADSHEYFAENTPRLA